MWLDRTSISSPKSVPFFFFAHTQIRGYFSMSDFPPNSRKAQTRFDEPKKLERVTSAEAQRRKRSLGRQFREAFIGGNARTAADYMLTDIVVPAIRDTLVDALQSG